MSSPFSPSQKHSEDEMDLWIQMLDAAEGARASREAAPYLPPSPIERSPAPMPNLSENFFCPTVTENSSKKRTFSDASLGESVVDCTASTTCDEDADDEESDDESCLDACTLTTYDLKYIRKHYLDVSKLIEYNAGVSFLADAERFVEGYVGDGYSERERRELYILALHNKFSVYGSSGVLKYVKEIFTEKLEVELELQVSELIEC